MRRGSGFTLSQLLTVVLLICTICALALPVLQRSIRVINICACMNNQAQLWKLAANYEVQFHRPKRPPLPETGSAFWTRMTRTDPPLVDPTQKDVLACPVLGEVEFGQTHFRGPSGNVYILRENEPVCADRIGNHGRGRGGNVLIKSGECITAEESDPVWAEAARTTCP